MNSKQDERRKTQKTARRREERRRARWESFPQRLLRKIDEAWPVEDVCDAVSMEVARARPDGDDCCDLINEIWRMMARQKQSRLTSEAADRLSNEIGMLGCALSEALALMEE